MDVATAAERAGTIVADQARSLLEAAHARGTSLRATARDEGDQARRDALDGGRLLRGRIDALSQPLAALLGLVRSEFGLLAAAIRTESEKIAALPPLPDSRPLSLPALWGEESEAALDELVAEATRGATQADADEPPSDGMPRAESPESPAPAEPVASPESAEPAAVDEPAEPAEQSELAEPAEPAEAAELPLVMGWNCTRCGGSGRCAVCGGSGRRRIRRCPRCKGSGRCERCSGSGRLEAAPGAA